PPWKGCSWSACSATCSVCRSCRRIMGCACCPGSCLRSRRGSAKCSVSASSATATSITCTDYERTTVMVEQKKTQAEKKSWLDAVRETIYGMSAHDMSRAALRTRASMEHLFILITMGDLLGIPILPPYYSLRLLPYVVPQIATWKRRMLREKDVA